ncbi:MAG: efflux RND transporter periplasmic adaptor subunit [Giesbergeria sp.]
MKKPKITFAVGSALLVLASHAVAHGDEDHSTSPPSVAAPAASAAPATSESVSPQRLADGSLFVPKSVQRQLGLRTRVAEVRDVPASVELAGKVVASANAGGLVQSGQAGRVEAAGPSLPVLGQVVRKGEVLARLKPVTSSLERGASQSQIAEIDAELAIAERKVVRYAELQGAVPQAVIDAAGLERDALRGRRSALNSGLNGAEALRAPISGVISASNVVAGQVVDVKEILFEVVDPSRLSVEALAYDPALTSGIAQASAAVPGGALSLKYLGTGRQLREQALVLLFGVQPGSAAVSVGQPVTVQASTSRRVHGAALARTAVIKTASGESAVWLHTEAERFVLHKVTAEPLSATELVVTQGVSQGDRVVTEGAGLLAQVR